ncbi:hypothetical protein [Halorubrum sp. DTA46]|uniref:hypothetical protein n=1 Tax=Halorubrum sp. DTA46 TaxID=3402162 RepID=UPI003AB016DF
MIEYVSIVGIIGTLVTFLMIVAMLYLVWLALGQDAHTPSPGETEQPELADGEESTETQGELTADGNSA